jgi:hypothetical protein
MTWLLAFSLSIPVGNSKILAIPVEKVATQTSCDSGDCREPLCSQVQWRMWNYVGGRTRPALRRGGYHTQGRQIRSAICEPAREITWHFPAQVDSLRQVVNAFAAKEESPSSTRHP